MITIRSFVPTIALPDVATIARSAGLIDAAERRVRAANRPDLATNLQSIGLMAGMARSLLLAATGKRDSAIVVLRAVAGRHDTLPYEFGPPATLKPPRELLGELLLADGKPDAARREFERALAFAWPLMKADFCETDLRGIRYGSRYGTRVINSSFGDWDLRPSLATLRIPLLVVHGEEETIPMDMTEEWITSMPRAAHFPYMERPDIVWPVVEKFLNGR